MIDLITKQRITVEGEPLTGAHIIVPIEQLPAVREGLERGGGHVLGRGCADPH